MPNICGNDFYAINCAGKPTKLNRDSNNASAHRDANACASPNRCSGNPTDSNSCDEYPYASSQQGGAGAVTRCVPAHENSVQGGTLSSFYTRSSIQDGDPYTVSFTNTDGIQYTDSCDNTGNEVIRRGDNPLAYGRSIGSAPLHRARRFLSSEGHTILMFEPRDQPGSLDSMVGKRTFMAHEDRYVDIVGAL